MKIYRVRVKFPSGFEHDVNVMPGSPLLFPNRGKPAKDKRPRIIASMADAIEYCNGALSNQVSPIELEFPESVTAVVELDPNEVDLTPVAKILGADPFKKEAK